ncbi:MAG: hypothetical protein KatS3mg031_0936 [Chitinophagales bacterium]|nr:MAG: hypothetical protein KatS3mg031_0936 [Chitinophagales bacterium]
MLAKIIHTYWTRLLATALVFITVLLTSRHLGADGKGLTSLITTNILLINLVNEMIGGVSLIYLIPRFSMAPLLIPVVVFTLTSSLALAIVFHYLQIIPPAYSMHLYLLAVLQTLSNTALYVLLAREKVKAHNYIFLLKTAIGAAYLALFFVYLGKASVMVFVESLYASNSIPLLVSMGVLVASGNRITISMRAKDIWQAIRVMFSFSSQAQMANIIQTLNYRLSFYLLNLFIGTDAVGIYSVTLALCDVVWMMSKSIGTVQLARIANTSEEAARYQLTRRVVRFSILSCLLLLIPLLLMPGKVFGFFFGPDFSGVSPLLLAMSPGIALFSINIILANYFAGTGQYFVNLIASAIGLAVNSAANMLLIPLIGLTGAAWSATLTYAAITLYTWLKFNKESPLALQDLILNRNDLAKIAAVLGFRNDSL